MVKVEKFDYNSFDDLAANTYVVYEGSEAVVIDPSQDYDGIVNYLEKHQLTPKAILLTHGHFDHFRGVERILRKYNVPVYIHSDDMDLLTNQSLNCSYYSGEDITYDGKVKEVSDNEVLKILPEDILVIHTPYHTMGSVCYYFKNSGLLFSGDSLFKGSVGNSSLPTSDARLMNKSLVKLTKLPKQTKVMPGHGGNTTIEYELSFNRFLN